MAGACGLYPERLVRSGVEPEMMTAAECLAKAAELDRLRQECLTEEGREAFARLGEGWRRTAKVSHREETWDKPHSAH